MFTFKDTEKYNSTLSQFCEEINVGRNSFYKWLREKEIMDSANDPSVPYQKYFIAYETTYSEAAGKPSFYITDEGKNFIKSILSTDDLLKMQRNKRASPRYQSNYKHFGNNHHYPKYTITVKWE